MPHDMERQKKLVAATLAATAQFRKKDIAEAIGVNPTRISELIGGKRWSEARLDKLEQWLRSVKYFPLTTEADPLEEAYDIAGVPYHQRGGLLPFGSKGPLEYYGPTMTNDEFVETLAWANRHAREGEDKYTDRLVAILDEIDSHLRELEDLHDEFRKIRKAVRPEITKEELEAAAEAESSYRTKLQNSVRPKPTKEPTS